MQIRSLVHRSNGRFKVWGGMRNAAGGDVREQSKEFIKSLYDSLGNTTVGRKHKKALIFSPTKMSFVAFIFRSKVVHKESSSFIPSWSTLTLFRCSPKGVHERPAYACTHS